MSERCPTCGSAQMTWTREAIIAAARASVDGPPTSKQWKNGTADHPAQSTVCKVFGSWNAMIEAAGWTPRPNNWHRQVKFSREQIVHEIFEFRVAHGRLPSYRDFTAPDPHQRRPSARTIERLFGSWNGALVAAGYDPPMARLSSQSYRAGMAQITKAAA